MSMDTTPTSTATTDARGTDDARLAHLATTGFVTDGGLETTLLFQEGIDLPEFAAFPLLADQSGRDALTRYYGAYQDIAERDGVGIVLDTATWRANADWGTRLGWSLDDLSAINRTAVDFIRDLADRRPGTPAVLNGVIGPRGDGYVVGAAMSAEEAKRYHLLQARAFAEAGADLITSVTMTYVDEAIGIVEAARAVGLPVAIGFTVETDGRLPSGQALGAAIEEVDERTGAAPAYFMVNCAHPSHFSGVLAEGGSWTGRIRAVRANASRLSHAELDEAEELDRGDPAELAADYVELARLLPDIRLVGGCCGTDHEHVAAISAALGSTR
jgi:S-methylmethionine-dependent homocysteine/selenocysteine methylase